MKTPITRRTVLRGLAGGTAIAMGLPLLECMFDRHGTALADGAPLPRRFGVFFWGGGLPWHSGIDPELTTPIADEWTPSATGADYALTRHTEVLRPVKAHVNVVTGFNYREHIDIPGGMNDPHHQGTTYALSGDQVSPEAWDHSVHMYKLKSKSLDQFVADHPSFYGDHRPLFRSLELGVSRALFRPYAGWWSISWRDKDSPNPPIRDPRELYSHVFGRVREAQSQDRAAREREQLAVDAVRDDARSLRTRLGRSDAQRLDLHLDHLASIEARLRQSSLATCSAPAAPAERQTTGDADNLERYELLTEILIAALRCDSTRVFSVQFTGAGTEIQLNARGQVDPGAAHNHSALHAGNLGVVTALTRYNVGGFARLVEKLAAETDATGRTLLDGTLLYGTSEYGAGWHHSWREHPVLLAGKAGGGLRTGLHVRKPGGNLAEVMLTMWRALGLNVPRFGGGRSNTEQTISQLLA